MDNEINFVLPNVWALYASLIARIPMLFVMDEILKVSFGLLTLPINSSKNGSSLPASISLENDPELFRGNSVDPSSYGNIYSKIGDGSERSILDVFNDATQEYFYLARNTAHDPLLMPLVATPLMPLPIKLFLLVLVFVNSCIAFMLSWEHLKKLYNVFGSMVCITLSYFINCAAVHVFFNEAHQDPTSLFQCLVSLGGTELAPSHVVALVTNYVIQALLCLCFIHLQLDIDDVLMLKASMMWAFLLPSGSMLITLSEEITMSVALAGAALPLMRLMYSIIVGIPKALLVLDDAISYAKMIIPEGGLHTLLELEWKRLKVPFVLRIFWTVRIANFVAFFIANYLRDMNTTNVFVVLSPSVLYRLFKCTMTYSCDTIIALLGMTSIVSLVCHYVEVFFQTILQSDDRGERSMGTVSAILFFVLAEQSGLTILEDDKRYVRLCKNFCLLFTAMLYLVHNMVNPVLMSLSASRNPSLSRHARALTVCAMLLLLPVSLLHVLWSVFELSTWLLAVSTFSFQVIIKTIVTVFIYGIFLADSYYSLFWENLDDYVYYIKAFGNTIEFLFGIVLFFNGLWIYFFESGGAIRAIMMCLHAYVNLWCEAKNGWSVFIKRRNAVRRVASIPDATRQQLNEHDDVCTICFQRLNSAKITRCNHFYHELCLRKWLYVQDSCPLCHKTLYNKDSPEEDDAGGGIVALGGLVEDMQHRPAAQISPRRVVEAPQQPGAENNVVVPQQTADGDKTTSDTQHDNSDEAHKQPYHCEESQAAWDEPSTSAVGAHMNSELPAVLRTPDASDPVLNEDECSKEVHVTANENVSHCFSETSLGKSSKNEGESTRRRNVKLKVDDNLCQDSDIRLDN
ncbi:TRC8 N-terminal domain [Trinorchestia longiramus]|nr:TRC8 N-terminal domain [Trinorchestia longiramus]